jgi:DNA-binding response OmpR family regulator
MIDDFKIRVDYFYRKIKKLNSNQNVIRYKDFYYYTNSKLLYLKNQKIKLSPNETTIVELLLFNINKPISKDQMFKAIDSYSDGTLRVYISKIKKIGLSLEYNRSTLSYILTNH